MLARKILNVGSDRQLVDERHKVLASAGFEVVSATNLLEVTKACEEHDFALVVLGQTLNINEKKRIKSTIRSACKRGTPVLALYQTSVSEADDADRALAAQGGPEALVKTAREMVDSKGQSQPKTAKAGRAKT